MHPVEEVHHIHHLVEGVAARLREKHQTIENAKKLIVEAEAYIAEHTPKAEALFKVYDAKRSAAVEHVLSGGKDADGSVND